MKKTIKVEVNATQILEQLDNDDIVEYVKDNRLIDVPDDDDEEITYSERYVLQVAVSTLKKSRNSLVAVSPDELKKELLELVDREYYMIKRY